MRYVLNPLAPLSRLWLLGAVFVLSVLSCGREITGPGDGIGRRVAHGMSFLAQFPGSFASLEQGAGSVVPFDRVRVVFRRMDGSVAFDRIVEFPVGANEVTLSFSVPLADDAPAEGEPSIFSSATSIRPATPSSPAGPSASSPRHRRVRSPVPPPFRSSTPAPALKPQVCSSPPIPSPSTPERPLP